MENLDKQIELFEIIKIKEKEYSKNANSEILLKEISWRTINENENEEYTNVKIFFGFPVSEVIFKAENSLMAILITQAKTQWNGLYSKDFKCFINKEEMGEIKFENFEKYKKMLKKNNKISIYAETEDAYTFLKQNKIEKK